MNENNKIENIILDYCEGMQHLEFSRDDLPEMIEKIKEAVLHEFEDSKKGLGENEAVKATLDRLGEDYQKALAKVVGVAQIAVGEGDCE